MKPAPPEPSDLVLRLRQQLILAQVRIMELEDLRENLIPRVAGLEKQRQAAQAIADQKIDEAAHLERVLAEARAQCEQLRQLQVRTTEELSGAVTLTGERNQRVRQLESALQQLEAELRAVKSSRSWRWTAWLRALGSKP